MIVDSGEFCVPRAFPLQKALGWVENLAQGQQFAEAAFCLLHRSVSESFGDSRP